MYLSKFPNTFVQIAKCICPNKKNVFVRSSIRQDETHCPEEWKDVTEEFICENCKIYLLKFQDIFVQIAKSICPNLTMYLFPAPSAGMRLTALRDEKMSQRNIFVKMAKCICQSSKIYLYVFVRSYICQDGTHGPEGWKGVTRPKEHTRTGHLDKI